MAAGLGFKDFVTGEVLTAADVDGYLMQGVWVFASAAARDAAVTSPQEGNFAYLKDTNVTTYYTGSAWANLDTTGMTNPMTTTGDTIYSSSGSTPARLGIGTTGQVLTVAGGVPTWAAPAGGGGFTSLASGSLPSADNLELTSISGDYKDLRLVLRNCQQASDNEILFRFNANANSIYGGLSQYGVDTTYTTGASAAGNRIYGTNDMQEASTTSTFQLDMYDYANTTANKLVRMQSQFTKLNTTDIAQFHIVGNFRSTSAISSIKVFANGIFNAGTYELFGIK